MDNIFTPNYRNRSQPKEERQGTRYPKPARQEIEPVEEISILIKGQKEESSFWYVREEDILQHLGAERAGPPPAREQVQTPLEPVSYRKPPQQENLAGTEQPQGTLYRKPPPKGPETKKLVWIRCRASDACPGQQAYSRRGIKMGNGATLNRFTCATCNKIFGFAH